MCWSLIESGLTGPAWRDSSFEGWEPAAQELVAELAPAVAECDDLLGQEPARALFDGLVHAVDHARYWQQPDGVDRALALPEVRNALVPLARRVAAAAPAWWTGPAARHAQRLVDWVDPNIPTTAMTGATGKLATWRAETIEQEKLAVQRPRDIRASHSGSWWSAPCLADLPRTTRVLPGLGAAGLVLVEDSMGWTAARCGPVSPTAEARIAEIPAAADWVDLVARYPLEVSLSRRHDWWRATGVEGSWLIPDHAALSQDYDAVHLTVAAYLTAAGVALPVGSSFTLIAGWNPDETYWLTDCLAPVGPSERWVRGQDGWTRPPDQHGQAF